MKKRYGVNRYELFPNDFQLAYDFDGNGVNTLGGAGEGNAEVISASADSGSPVFLNGRIAGIAVTGVAATLVDDVIVALHNAAAIKVAGGKDAILTPMRVPQKTICAITNIHRDGDVDDVDFTIWQQQLGLQLWVVV